MKFIVNELDREIIIKYNNSIFPIKTIFNKYYIRQKIRIININELNDNFGKDIDGFIQLEDYYKKIDNNRIMVIYLYEMSDKKFESLLDELAMDYEVKIKYSGISECPVFLELCRHEDNNLE
jgi:hypothetical protein